MEALLRKYPNDVKVVFKNYPLSFHDQAEPAAKAALAAAKQGKFWEFHDVLFANQAKFGASFFEETAKSLGLDMDKFRADIGSPEIAKAIIDDSLVATHFKVGGTPVFFVNGVRVPGAYDADYFEKIITTLLSE